MDKNLAAFLAIARAGTLSEAARALSITQPSLTKRLQNLEEFYDCRLFDRQPRGMDLTEVGRRFLHHAKRVEQEMIQAGEVIDRHKGSTLENLQIGCGPLFHLRYIAPAWKMLKARYSNLKLQLEAGVNPILLPKLRQGEVDLVFGTREVLDENDPIIFIPLTRVDTGVVIRTDNPLAEKAEVTAGDLIGLEWITYSNNPHFFELVQRFFEQSGLRPPQESIRTTSFTMGLQYVDLGQAVMTAPLQLAPVLRMPTLRILRSNPPISASVGGAFLRRSSLGTPEAIDLVEMIRGLCREQDESDLA